MYRRAGATASRCNRTDIASSQQQPTPRHGLTRSGRVLLSSASVCLVCACVLLSLLLCLGSPVSSSSPSTYSAGPVSFGRSGVEIHSSLLLGAWSCDSALTPSIVHVRVNAAEGDKLRVIVQTNTGEELSIGSHTAETRFDFSYARPSHLPVGAGLRVDHATSLRVTMQCKNSWFTCTQVRFDVDIRCETMPPNRAECTQRRDNTQQLRTDVQSVEVDKAGAIHIGWRIQQAESKADHSHPHSLFASVSVGWQLPSNYFTEQGALIGAGAPNVQRGCSMHWVPAPAFASNNHSMLSTGESSNATSHLRVVHGGPPTPQDLPDWIRVQISRDGQIVAEHYHAISARHWTALLYRQERAAPAINFGLIDLLSHLGLVPLLGDLVPAFIEADQQLRFLLLGSQDTCKSTVANGIYNLARVPPAKVTEADNSRPHFQPIVAPLLTGNGLGQIHTAHCVGVMRVISHRCVRVLLSAASVVSRLRHFRSGRSRRVRRSRQLHVTVALRGHRHSGGSQPHRTREGQLAVAQRRHELAADAASIAARQASADLECDRVDSAGVRLVREPHASCGSVDTGASRG